MKTTSTGGMGLMKGRQWLVGVSLVMCALFAPHGAQAASEVYTVAKIRLDAMGENAVVAKKKALAEGPLLALKSLYKRLAPFRAYDRLAGLTIDDAEKALDGVQVRSERNSSTRYLALMDYKFSPRKMQALLARRGVPFYDGRSRKQVVLPVTSLSEDDRGNRRAQKVWLRAWRGIDLRHGLTRTRLGKAGRADRDVWGRLSSGEELPFDQLLKRHGARHLVLVGADIDNDAKKLTLRLVGRDQSGRFDHSQDIPFANSLAETHDIAAKVAHGILEGRWREPHIEGEVVAYAPDGGGTDQAAASARLVNETIFMRVTFRGLRDWRKVRSKLQGMPGVQKLKVNSLSPRGADVRLLYPGGLHRFENQIGVYGFVLERRGSENILSSAGFGR